MSTPSSSGDLWLGWSGSGDSSEHAESAHEPDVKHSRVDHGAHEHLNIVCRGVLVGAVPWASVLHDAILSVGGRNVRCCVPAYGMIGRMSSLWSVIG